MVHKKFSPKRIRKNLVRRDRRKGLAEKRKKLVLDRNLSPDSVLNDAGRTLPYYGGIIEQILQRFPDLRGKAILHIASSIGVLTKYLQDRQAFAVGVDMDREYLDIAKKLKNKNLVRADASLKYYKTHGGMRVRDKPLSLPFADNSFDCLVSDRFAFSNYHSIDPPETQANFGSAQILKEATRIIKPNGIFVLTGVNGGKEDWNRIGKLHFSKVILFTYRPPGFLYPMQGVVLSGPRKETI